MDNKLKHLELISDIIARLGSNSFLLKGWAITLVTLLSGLTTFSNGKSLFLLSYFILVMFWMLDGFYLSKERQFRLFFAEVAKKDDNEIDFSMNIKEFNKGKNNWIRSILSKTLFIFYFTIAIVILAFQIFF